VKCPTCGHDDGVKLPPMRPMGMIPYLLSKKERKALLTMATDVGRVWTRKDLGLRALQRGRRDLALLELGLVVMVQRSYRITPKGMIAAIRVKEWEEVEVHRDFEWDRATKVRRKRSALADAVLANAGVPKWELSHAAD
jgi:hypothetical protein